MQELTLEEWYEIVKRGTSGDQVYDILKSWKADREQLLAEKTKIWDAFAIAVNKIVELEHK